MKYILSLSVLLFLFGCGSNGQIEQELSTAAKLMRSEPDSSLRIIENIDPDKILRRSTRAKYALIYSAVLDKNYMDTDDDSLIRIAYRYYEKRLCSDSLRFQINYHYGRVCQNAEDYSAAIRYYLMAKKYVHADNNYFLGLVYSRIGDVYSEQMNYNGMLEYYNYAYESLKNIDDPAYQNSAILNIANAYSSLGDNDNAMKYYYMALEIARQEKNEEIEAACLSNIGSVYANEGEYQKAMQVVKKILAISPTAMSIYEYTILSKAYYLQNKIDSAQYYLNEAFGSAADIRDEASLTYLSYQLETAAGNHAKAGEAIDEYIALSDSISRMVVYQSATAAEGKYYKEQTAFALYRLRMRKIFEYVIISIICLIITFLIHFYRQRIRKKQEQILRYMSLVDNIRLSKDRILAQLEEKVGMETRLKELVLSRFDILDKLGRAFYERDTTKAQQETIYKQAKTFIADLSSNSATKKEMEEIINTVNDNIITKLRAQFPKFKPADIDLLIYIYAGFSAQIISVLIDDSVPNIYNRKSRLKARISVSDAPDKELFIQKLI